MRTAPATPTAMSTLIAIRPAYSGIVTRTTPAAGAVNPTIRVQTAAVLGRSESGEHMHTVACLRPLSDEEDQEAQGSPHQKGAG